MKVTKKQKEVPNGIYFCRLEIGRGKAVGKLALIK
jgi:hypothetical protein